MCEIMFIKHFDRLFNKWLELKVWLLGAPKSMKILHEHGLAFLCSKSSPKMYSFLMFSNSFFKLNIAFLRSKTFPIMYSFPMFIQPFEVLGGIHLFLHLESLIEKSQFTPI